MQGKMSGSPLRIIAAIALLLLGLPAQSASAGSPRFNQQGPRIIGNGAIGTTILQGSAVAASADGNTVIVGGRGDNSGVGAVWVFTRSNGVWGQQWVKLAGNDAAGAANQGWSVALSADGNTAIVGGSTDNGNAGAAWVFTRSNGVWTQQGPKLVGTGAIGTAQQGISVALSADGNTAMVGGFLDNGNAGAAWVFTRSNGVWTQQGPKLVGTGAIGAAQQGRSVKLSSDGNTAIVGGWTDNGIAGAAWVFTRSNGVWTQQGPKLVGTGAAGAAAQGIVALSADGNTAIVGGYADNGNAGAAWVFTRSNGVWTQQGGKLVGTGAVGNANQGFAVALSADGNTAIVGGRADDGQTGAAWVFIRSNGVWTQQGGKMVGTGAVGNAEQGLSVTLSADGSTAIVGGILDNNSFGAAWVFFRDKAASHDFNGSGASDIAWRDNTGNTALWLMSGDQVSQSGSLGLVPTTWTIVGQRDFDGDGKDDLLWRDGTSGTVTIWLLNGLQVSQSGSLGSVPTSWSVIGTGDFDGDGKGDLLWRDSSGNVAIWLLNGLAVAQSSSLGTIPTSWSVVGVADFNGDGKADILWRDSSGNVAIWLMNGLQIQSAVTLGVVPTTWSVVATGDFNGDGKWDVLWRDSSGALAIWLMNGLEILSTGWLGMMPNYWLVAETGDFNGDGLSDILWRDTTTGAVGIWFMNGAQIAQSAGLGVVPPSWIIQGANAD